MTTTGTKTLLRLKTVQEHVGLSKATIYRFMKMGVFPQSIPLGESSVAWDSDEIQAWIQSRIASCKVKP